MPRAPLLLFLLTVALYAPGLGGGFIYDDEQLLVENSRVITAGVRKAFTTDYWGVTEGVWQSPIYRPSIHYRPLAILAFSGIYHLFGFSPFAFHGFDMLLHAGAVVALYFLILGLGWGEGVATAGAALFVVHPLHVEAVAWIAGLPETLGGAAVIASLALFVHKRYAWSWGLAVIALLTKETALVLPALIFVVASGPMKDRIRAALPFAGLDAAYLLLRILVLPSPPGGALLQSVVAGLSIMPAIAAHYVRALFFPWPLALDYVIPGGAQIAVAAVIVAAWIALRKTPGMLVAAALAGLPLLLPVAATPAMYDLKIQDRYTYLATVGACLAVALLLRKLPGRGLFLACLFLVPLGALGTYLQIQCWQSNETLWTHTLEVTPSSRFGALDLGYELYVEKRFGEAERVYRNGLRYHPDDPELKRYLAIMEKEQHKGRSK